MLIRRLCCAQRAAKFNGSRHKHLRPFPNPRTSGIDYDDFSVRIPEAQLPRLLEHLSSIPADRVDRMHKATLQVRDFFVYKDMYNPDVADRRQLLQSGRPGRDAFLLLTAALEARAVKILAAMGGNRARQPRAFRRLKLQFDSASEPGASRAPT